MLEQLILQDVKEKPENTHTYLFAGSEETGNAGLLCMLGCTLGINLTIFTAAFANPAAIATGLISLPLLLMRIGVTGSKNYASKIKNNKNVKAVIAIDSVGEGEFVIPESSMGTSLYNIFIPKKACKWLNKLIRESACELKYPYKKYLFGGTTDHLSFLEKGFPAAAILTDKKGKASPFIIGGKLHTKKDTYDKIDKEKLKETWNLINLVIKKLNKSYKKEEPKDVNYSLAKLYKVNENYYLGLKDIKQDNKAINAVYKVEINKQDSTAIIKNKKFIDWSKLESLDENIKNLFGNYKRLNLEKIILDKITFEKRKSVKNKIKKYISLGCSKLGDFAGNNSMLVLLGLCGAAWYTVPQVYSMIFNNFESMKEWPEYTHYLIETSALLSSFVLFSTKGISWLSNLHKSKIKADNLDCLVRKS